MMDIKKTFSKEVLREFKQVNEGMVKAFEERARRVKEHNNKCMEMAKHLKDRKDKQ